MNFQRAAINAETPRPTYSRGADGRWLVEASELRLRPGEWPLSLTINTSEYGPTTFGRFPYNSGLGHPDVERDADGDVVAVHYYGPYGIHLIVVND